MAREAIEVHLEGLIDAGQPILKPGVVEHYKGKRAYAGETWAVVSVNPSAMGRRAKRVQITIPRRLFEAVDRFAKRNRESRSGVLVRAGRHMGWESHVVACE